MLTANPPYWGGAPETGAGVLAVTHDEELLARWTAPSAGPTVRMS